jgi:arylsulfatase A-like enzyme
VSFLRGQYAHNHGVLDNKNSPRQPGGYEGFRELELQDSTAATWLDDVGYDTFYAGKLLNGWLQAQELRAAGLGRVVRLQRPPPLDAL